MLGALGRSRGRACKNPAACGENGSALCSDVRRLRLRGRYWIREPVDPPLPRCGGSGWVSRSWCEAAFEDWRCRGRRCSGAASSGGLGRWDRWVVRGRFEAAGADCVGRVPHLEGEELFAACYNCVGAIVAGRQRRADGISADQDSLGVPEGLWDGCGPLVPGAGVMPRQRWVFKC